MASALYDKLWIDESNDEIFVILVDANGWPCSSCLIVWHGVV